MMFATELRDGIRFSIPSLAECPEGILFTAFARQPSLDF